VRRPGGDRVAVLLGQAAPDHDLELGTALLLRLQVPEVAVQLVVGVLPDAARVEHDDIGVGEVVGRRHAVGLEQPGDALGVVLVHLAPEGADEVAARDVHDARLRVRRAGQARGQTLSVRRST
jgi:hypothetical protein